MSADPDHAKNPPMPIRPVLILGASTRAAAHSALRAGLSPICADMFADRDLVACARVLEVGDYPQGLVAAAATAPPAPWMYTGGLENHPRIVDQVSKTRPLWGNAGDVLRRIRDPWNVAGLLVEHGLPACRAWPRDGTPPAADWRWMLKPLRGAAGRGIRIWEDYRSELTTLHEPHYFQERRVGVPISALFLALPDRTIRLGVARQLVGMQEVHAPPFAWCGTIAPVELPVGTEATITRIGDLLARQTGLRGLFGCDFIVEVGTPWLTEVNPRYPASTEIIERVLRVPLLDWHRRACESFGDSGRPFVDSIAGDTRAKSSPGTPSRKHCTGVIGKIVVYAGRDVVAPDALRFVHRRSHGHDSGEFDGALPYMADIAAPGTRIACGQPISTLFARAASEPECLAKLVRRAKRFESQCNKTKPGG
jgi:predicted ATP-grasp superfamily ATP-dependent carboligase